MKNSHFIRFLEGLKNEKEFKDLETFTSLTPSKEELAKYLNVNIRTIGFYSSPTYRKRNNKGNCYIVIRVKEGENDE